MDGRELERAREMKYKKRVPPSGILHYPHRGVDEGHHSCKTTEHKITDSPPPPSFKCNVLRESLSVDSQNIPCATLKRRGVVGNLRISLKRAPQAEPVFVNFKEPRSRFRGIVSASLWSHRVCICKPFKETQESIPSLAISILLNRFLGSITGYKYGLWRAGKTNRVFVPALQAGNRFLGYLNGLQIQTLFKVHPSNSWSEIQRRPWRGAKFLQFNETWPFLIECFIYVHLWIGMVNSTVTTFAEDI